MTSFGEIMASETMVECGESLIILGLLMICNILLVDLQLRGKKCINS